MFYYTAYGLLLKTSEPLSGFISKAAGTPNITLLKEPPSATPPRSQAGIVLDKIEDGLSIHWPGIASYAITEGRQIIITPERNPRFNLELQPLYGIALAAILQQRGLLVLHGSSVEINGRGLLIIGRKGYGKSTITASLLSRGHTFLTDDVSALELSPTSPPQILPGIPRLKLWPDAMTALEHNPKDFPVVAPTIQKHILHYPRQFGNKSAPLQTIVLLEYGDSVQIRKLTETEKAQWLLGNQYFSKYYHAFDSKTHNRIFRQCVSLIRQTEIVRLQLLRDIQVLPEVTTLLEEHITESSKPPGAKKKWL